MTLATPVGRSAIATVMLWGDDATSLVHAKFRAASGLALSDIPLDRITFGTWKGDDGPGEELVVCRRNEQLIEIHCHGGIAAHDAIISSLVSSGCLRVDWHRWLQSTGGEKVAVEARIALAGARTTRTAEILLGQLNGALQNAISSAIHHLNVNESPTASQIIDRLVALANVGLHLATPWQVVLAGSPNVGKSSLINAILGYERAIVYDQPGTTRDVVAASTAIDGWPLELADTAGLRVAEGAIEEQGVSMARGRAAQADLLLLVFDASLPWSDADTELLSQHPHALIIHNKCDQALDDRNRPDGIHTSATCGDGIQTLLETVVSRLVPVEPDVGEAVPFTQRQVAHLSRAAERQGVDDRNSAIKLLEEI